MTVSPVPNKAASLERRERALFRSRITDAASVSRGRSAMLKGVFVSIIVIVTSAGCDKPSTIGSRPLQAVSRGVDVTVGGKRMYGISIYYESKETKKVERASTVVLMPWDERPEVEVSLVGDISIVTVNGSDYQIKGSHVCETDGRGTKVAIYPGQIAAEAYGDKATLRKAVAELISQAEQRRATEPARAPSVP